MIYIKEISVTHWYYIISMILIQLIYIIPYVDQDSLNGLKDETASVEHQLELILMISFSFSIVTLFTLIIDNFLRMIKFNSWNPFEINSFLFPDALLLLSLIASSICILFDEDYSIEFLFVMISYGQLIMLYSLYGKLIQLNNSNISITRYLFISLLFYLLSEIFLNKAMIYSNIHDNNIWMILSILFNSLSFGIQFNTCFIYFKEKQKIVADVQFNSQENLKYLHSLTETYSYMITIVLCSLYLFIRLIILITVLNNQFNENSLLKCNIIMQLVIVLLVSIMPGRIQYVDAMNFKRKLEYKETFIRYLSHEIRSPLSTATLGLHHLLSSMQSSTIAYQEAIEIISDAKSATELAADTMDDLLLYDKISCGKLELNLNFRNHWNFIVDCVKPFRTQAMISKLKLTCKLANEMYKVHCILIDIKQMNQVMRNILTNAMKFTPSQGSIEVLVTISPSFSNNNPMQFKCGDKGVLRISVIDTGTGIAKEKLSDLFTNPVNFNSLGIGLRLSKSIIEMHNGYIGATSDGLNKGSTFYIELPCFSEKEAEKSYRSSNSSGSMNSSLRKPSLLHSKSDHIQQTSLRITDTIIKAQLKSLPISMQASKLAHQLNTPSKALIINITSHELDGVPGRRKSVKTKFDLAIQLRAIAEEGSWGGSDKENDFMLPENTTTTIYYNQDKKETTATNTTTTNTSIATEITTSTSILEDGNNNNGALCINTNFDNMNNISDKCEEDQNNKHKNHFLTSERSNLYVLLADDAPLTRKMVTRSISSLCRDCDQASHGLEAVTKVANSIDRGDPYDVVIIDYYMPVMNGNEAIRTMRSNGYVSIILAVTGSAAKDDEESLLAAGADAVVLKPLTLEVFKRKINEVLEKALKSHSKH